MALYPIWSFIIQCKRRLYSIRTSQMYQWCAIRQTISQNSENGIGLSSPDL